MHLSAQASIQVPPPELVATLVAIHVASTAALAQRHVNDKIAKAGTAAAGAPGARTFYRGYVVTYSEEKPPHGTARQDNRSERRGQTRCSS